MTLIPTHSDLRSTLESKQCEDVHELLSKHYEHCRVRLDRFKVTGSPNYKCHFSEPQLHWLGVLLKSWPVNKKVNLIPLFLKKQPSLDLSSTLRDLGLKRHEVLRVETSFKILTLASQPQASTAELEELAIRCSELSRCRFCEYAQVTTNYATEDIHFKGCIENPKIAEPIFGECSLFLRRGSIDEQNVA